jgi:hypothetical protein
MATTHTARRDAPAADSETARRPTIDTPSPRTPCADRPEGGEALAIRRVGYLVTMAVNALLLLAVDNVQDWDLSFLTGELDQVIPMISVSLLVGIAVNAAFLWYDVAWFKSIGQIVSLGVSLAATVRVYQVFPFDFSGHGFDWDLLVRIGLVVAIVGTAAGILVELVKLIAAAIR